ncbi:esterase [Arthrobacter phage Seahorse]|uniref:Esterase n=1 Tax=Arthrobacter phage Seahorse TaxID=2419611 RepID=A0A3G3M680_9CAUD|nr:esterase [Arthrobacter phage Seahorse]AYR01534.1 esterase [Arthrobacter phage Seahorse]
MKRFAVLAAAAIVLSGCAAQTPPPVSAKVQDYYDKNVAGAKATLPASKVTGTAAAKAVTGTIGADRVNLFLAPKSNGKLVIAAHGHGGTVQEWTSGKQQLPMLDALVDAGYSVAASDAAGEAWGNPESVDAYKALTAWAKTKGKFKSVVVLGQSMGGLPALQLLGEIPNVTAFVGIYPVCDLATVIPRFKDTAAAWPDGAEGKLSPVDLQSAKGKRMIFFASPQDTIVPKATNTDACAKAAKAAGADVSVVEVKGDHGDQDAFRPADVIEFLAGA